MKVDKVDPPRAERFEGSAYTEEEVQELLEKTADHRLGLLIYVTVLLGLRRSEVLGLRWKAIDFDENKITINHTCHRSTGGRQTCDRGRGQNKNKVKLPNLSDGRDIEDKALTMA